VCIIISETCMHDKYITWHMYVPYTYSAKLYTNNQIMMSNVTIMPM